MAGLTADAQKKRAFKGSFFIVLTQKFKPSYFLISVVLKVRQQGIFCALQ